MVLIVDEIAKRLHISPITVRALLREGRLPGFKLTKRLWGVLESDLEAWIEARKSKTSAQGGEAK